MFKSFRGTLRYFYLKKHVHTKKVHNQTSSIQPMKAILAILALCFTLFSTASAEEPKMKATDQTIKVETKLGVGRFNTILDGFKEQGIEIGKRNHPAPPAEVEITYVSYTNPGKDETVTPAQIEADLRAIGYRSATIEELASVNAGNPWLTDGQKAVAFGTQLTLSATESFMFQVSIKGDQTSMGILKTGPTTSWGKKGLKIPAVKLKTPGGKVTV
jgi:hypothetical protein